MYKNELDKHIRNATTANSFIFFGESIFLIDLYVKKVTKIDDASVVSFYYDEYDFSSAKAHLSQASLFNEKNVLIIKTEKKILKKELDILIELSEKNKNNVFVYAYYGDDYKAYTKVYTNKNVMSVRFFNPNYNESFEIMTQLAKEKKLDIDRYAISHLLNMHNGDIALSLNEIDKLKVYNRAITVKDIESLVFGLAEVNIDELIKKILTKKDFKKDLLNILEHGEDEIRIITALTSYLTQLYMFNIYIRVNGAANALEILGYRAPKFVVDEKAALCLKFKPNKYYKLHYLLLNSELDMKSSNVDKSAILLSTLIKIQQLL